MRSKPRSANSRAGFTLVEMLVVVAIIALGASLAMPLLTKETSDHARLQTTATDLLGALRLTRSDSILRQAESTLSIDVEKRTIESPAVRLRVFDSDIVALLKIAEPENISLSLGGIRFFADGSSTGGDLILKLHDHETTLCVNWLTGIARQARHC